MADVTLNEVRVSRLEGVPGGQPNILSSDIHGVNIADARRETRFSQLIQEELSGGFRLKDISYATKPIEAMLLTLEDGRHTPVTLILASKAGYEIKNGQRSYFVLADTIDSDQFNGKQVAVAMKGYKFGDSISVIWETDELICHLVATGLDSRDLGAIVASLD